MEQGDPLRAARGRDAYRAPVLALGPHPDIAAELIHFGEERDLAVRRGRQRDPPTIGAGQLNRRKHQPHGEANRQTDTHLLNHSPKRLRTCDSDQRLPLNARLRCHRNQQSQPNASSHGKCP